MNDKWTPAERIAYLEGRVDFMARERDAAVAELKALFDGYCERRTAAFERLSAAVELIAQSMRDDLAPRE